MKWLQAVLLIFFTGIVFCVQAEDSLDELVSRVRQEAQQDRHYDEAREQRFIRERDQQQARLTQLRNELSHADKLADSLRATFQENETKLAALDEQITAQAGELNNLFAVVQQNAAEISALLDRSMISAQYPQRGAFLQQLIQKEKAVSMETLKQLWQVLLDEMHETGKVVRFSGPVITLDGEEQTETVMRVGVFNASSGGHFLRYLPENRELVELARQPTRRYQTMAKELEQAQDGWRPMPVDPSKGAILALLVQSPDFGERLQQSGVIGYLILALGAVGFLIVLWRGLILARDNIRVKGQMKQETHRENNPLGRLMAMATTAQCRNSEAMAVRLDETVNQESSRLFFGLTTLTVFAAVTPLLGLLGTVIGMIETFQSISLFGTGDPKLMAGGISYALVTTQLGLAVAIPLLLLQSFLHAQANRIVEILDQQSARLFEIYDQQRNPSVSD